VGDTYLDGWGERKEVRKESSIASIGSDAFLDRPAKALGEKKRGERRVNGDEYHLGN